MCVQIRSKQGHFLREDLATFDAEFFDFTAAEASAMDPQQRGLLETTYRALENGKSCPDSESNNLHLTIHRRHFDE
jgi:acyl transferase domain-containing protein